MKDKILKFIGRFFCWIIILYILMPIIVLIINSFNKSKFFEFPPTGFSLQWFQKFLRNKEYQASLGVSVKISAVSALCGILIGTPAAYALKRYKFKGSGALHAFFLSPLMLPSVVWALGLIQFMNLKLLPGSKGILGTFWGLIAVHVVIILPYVIRMVMTSLSYMDPEMETAAQSLGAHPVRAFFEITIPSISPGIIVGAIFGFMVSFTDVVVTSFIGGAKFITFPVRMYSEIRTEGLDPLAVAVSAMVVVVLVIISFICEKSFQWSKYI